MAVYEMLLLTMKEDILSILPKSSVFDDSHGNESDSIIKTGELCPHIFSRQCCMQAIHINELVHS